MKNDMNDTKAIFSEKDAENLFYYGREDADEKLEHVIGMMNDKQLEASVFQTIGVVFAREYRRHRAELGEPTNLTDRQMASAFNTAIKIADMNYCMSGCMYSQCLREAFSDMCCDVEDGLIAA